MINLTLLDKQKKYIVAVSGGPDSMALLAMVKDYNIICAHVNYNARTTSHLDEEIVRNYCSVNNIEFYIKNSLEKVNENFQMWAREYRYNWFAKLAKEHSCDAVLVAHHQDDLLETYIMQKNRKNFVKHFGINEVSLINGCNIIRPLLKQTKLELIKFAEDNGIRYAIDETNDMDIYQRNIVRKQINSLNDDQRELLLKEIDDANRKNDSINKEIDDNYNKFVSGVKISNLLYNNIDEVVFGVLYKYLVENNFPIKKIKGNIMQEMKSFISKAGNRRVKMNLPGPFHFIKDGDQSYIEGE